MKRLFLLRHAKSSHDDPALKDFDRPLNSRGEEACRTMAEYAAEHDIRPDLVLVSPARRTMATFEGIMAAINADWPHETVPALYGGSAATVIEVIRRAPEAADALMVVGHNPALQETAEMLTGDDKAGKGAHMARKFPSAALAELQFDIAHWADLSPGEGRLVAFVRPQDLTDPARARHAGD